MTILNMTYGQGNPYQPFHLNAISDLSITGGDTQATITWTDPGNLVVDGQTLATWSSTKLVRKVGSAPSDSSDGTLVVTETVADTYSSTGYTDTGLTNGTTYYYKAFAVGDNSTESASNSANVTPQAGWQPGANTVAYYPLDSTNTVNDLSGNSYNLSLIGTANFNTYQGVDCFNSQGTGRMECASLTSATIGTTFTAMVWVYTIDRQDHNERGILGATDNSSGFRGFDLFESYYSGQNQAYRGETLGSSNVSISINKPFGQWYHLCMTYETGTNNQKFYINGQLEGQNTNNMYTSSSDKFWVACRVWSNGGIDIIRSGGLSKIIIEDKARTAQEISDYYDQTKGDYGIS